MTTTVKFLLGALAIVALAGCNKEDPANSDPIPYVYVNEQLNLSSIDYAPLRNDGGSVTIPGGARGILVVRQSSSQYLAFERTCTFKPGDSCAVVSPVASRLYFEDACCGSQFNLDGTVRFGPANRSLLRYNTSLSGNLLTITN